MAKRTKSREYADHSDAEVREAFEALGFAMDAAGDDEEFVKRMTAVPVWVFVENPETRKIIQAALPDVLSYLKDRAAQDPGVAEELFQRLELNPTWQSLFKKTEARGGKQPK